MSLGVSLRKRLARKRGVGRWRRCKLLKCFRLGGASSCGVRQQALVSAVLDLAAYALPVRLKRAVPLQNHLEAKAEGRVSDLLLSERIDLPLHILPRNGGLDALDAHE